MRIDTQPVESPSISWAECKRETLLFRRLLLMSGVEITILGFTVMGLIAIIALITGESTLATRAGILAIVLIVAAIGLELGYRAVLRCVGRLDAVVEHEHETSSTASD